MKPTIGVLFGSQSPEHEVSIITGVLIADGLKKLGYGVVPVYISQQGDWYSGDELGSLKFFKSLPTAEQLRKFGPWSLVLNGQQGKFVLERKGFSTKRLVMDIIFPAFHGAFGEDGTAQGLFEMTGVPYVGCGVAASAITMDKILTKQFYQSQNLPTTAFVPFTKEEWQKDAGLLMERIQKLRYPLFVKPATLGSSIGIAKVGNADELRQAIEVALYYDRRVLVEEGVEHLMDVTCAIIGNSEPIASELQESVFAGKLFDYNAKYLEDGGAQIGNATQNIVIPARLDETTTLAVKDMAKRIYLLLECEGTARVDFLYNKETKELFANEINPLPGTLYHHLWKKSGIEFPELLEKLIGYALERKERQKQYQRTFSSTLLQSAQSTKLSIKLQDTVTPHD